MSAPSSVPGLTMADLLALAPGAGFVRRVDAGQEFRAGGEITFETVTGGERKGTVVRKGPRVGMLWVETADTGATYFVERKRPRGPRRVRTVAQRRDAQGRFTR